MMASNTYYASPNGDSNLMMSSSRNICIWFDSTLPSFLQGNWGWLSLLWWGMTWNASFTHMISYEEENHKLCVNCETKLRAKSLTY